ncbi:MAG: hypothetical protein HGGPFJEG_00925 [Ignavibacteria bacterium]|nr:hypothetical protein [Ignavibacteria bacterium]
MKINNMKKIIIVVLLIASAPVFSQSNFVSGKSESGKSNWKNSLSSMIMVEGSYYRNLSDFGQVYNKSTGIYLNYARRLNNSYQILLKSGYTEYKTRDESIQDSTSLTSVPIQFGFRYYVLPDRVMPYFSFMNGFNIISQQRELDGDPNDETLVRYMWQVGFGIAFKIFKEVNLDLCAKYNNNFYHPDAMNTSFEYSGGLSYNFGY